QSMHTITLQEALKLFELPRTLGELDGEPLTAGIGRFGPFVKLGSTYASLKAGEDPHTIDYERAVELIREKQALIANRTIKTFEGSEVQVLNGRYGPYITDGRKNARIPKEREPADLTLEECVALLAAAPEKKGRGRCAARKAAAGDGAAAAKKAVRKAPAKKTAGTTAKKTAKKAAKKTAKKAATKTAKQAAAKKAAARKPAASP